MTAEPRYPRRLTRVFNCPWQDDFAAVRNEGLRRACGDWVFWLDADERLDEANRASLGELFGTLTEEPRAYLVRQRSVPATAGDPAPEVDMARLFRNLPGVRFRYRVREEVFPSLQEAGVEVVPSSVAIQHLGYQRPEVRRRRPDRNRRLTELDVAEHPGDALPLVNLAALCLEDGREREVIAHSWGGLERMSAVDSLCPTAHPLLVQSYRRIGEAEAYGGRAGGLTTLGTTDCLNGGFPRQRSSPI